MTALDDRPWEFQEEEEEAPPPRRLPRAPGTFGGRAWVSAFADQPQRWEAVGPPVSRREVVRILGLEPEELEPRPRFLQRVWRGVRKMFDAAFPEAERDADPEAWRRKDADLIAAYDRASASLEDPRRPAPTPPAPPPVCRSSRPAPLPTPGPGIRRHG